MTEFEKLKSEIRSTHNFAPYRCSRCGMRPDYLNECFALLDAWPKSGKKTKELLDKINSFRCKKN